MNRGCENVGPAKKCRFRQNRSRNPGCRDAYSNKTTIKAPRNSGFHSLTPSFEKAYLHPSAHFATAPDFASAVSGSAAISTITVAKYFILVGMG